MNLVGSLASSFLLAFGMIGCASFGPYAGAMGQPGGAPAAAGPAATSTTPENPAAAASAPASNAGPVSVTIRSSCSKTVKVFYGDKPKFGSGTYSTASSNSVSSHSFRPGDLFWIVDEHENGVASVTVQAATHEIEIRGSCTELAAR